MKKQLNAGGKPVKSEALCLSERKGKQQILVKAYWESCRERIQLYQKLENEKWVFYQ